MMDVAALAQLLHETADHHGSFEAVAPPHDWWDWYAAYMDARERGSTPEEASAAAALYGGGQARCRLARVNSASAILRHPLRCGSFFSRSPRRFQNAKRRNDAAVLTALTECA
jgi:hypothetical protein